MKNKKINKRKSVIIMLIIMIFTLNFSANKLSAVYNAKTASIAFPKNKRYKVITTIDAVTDYATVPDFEWIYNDIFVSAKQIYEVYSYELDDQGWYDSNYVILLSNDLLQGISIGDRVEITYIDIDLIPAQKNSKGEYLTDATSASIILDIKKK